MPKKKAISQPDPAALAQYSEALADEAAAWASTALEIALACGTSRDARTITRVAVNMADEARNHAPRVAQRRSQQPEGLTGTHRERASAEVLEELRGLRQEVAALRKDRKDADMAQADAIVDALNLRVEANEIAG